MSWAEKLKGQGGKLKMWREGNSSRNFDLQGIFFGVFYFLI